MQKSPIKDRQYAHVESVRPMSINSGIDVAPEERPRGITIGFYAPANEKANVKPVRPMSINSGIDVAPEERPRGITIGFHAPASESLNALEAPPSNRRP